MLGGKITVNSNIGQGSLFCLSFPNIVSIDHPDLVAESFINEDFNQFLPATILIVDDVKSNRDLIRYYFDQSEHSILEAKDGLEALEMAKNYHPDLILMDLLMPNLGGIQATHQLRQDVVTQHIPILVLTAALLQDVHSQLENECQGFITKPLSRRELITHLQGILPLRRINIPLSPTAKTKAIALPLANPEGLKTLINHLEDIELETWKKLRNTMIMRDLRQFAQQLRQWSDSYPYPQLLDYVERLEKPIRAFDGEKLTEVMSQFPQVRQSLQAILSSQDAVTKELPQD